jgi:hypothetical protein
VSEYQNGNCTVLLGDYRLILERYARPNDPESYSGRSVSSWKGHPCHTGKRVRARRSAWSSRGGGQDPHRAVAPVNKEKEEEEEEEEKKKKCILVMTMNFPV